MRINKEAVAWMKIRCAQLLFGCIVFYNTDESDAGMIRAS
jgi:hypothetical protein